MPIIYFDSKDKVPADLSEVAVEETAEGENKGKWAVNVVPRKKLDEFRETNTTVSKKLEETDNLLKAVVKATGVDIEKFDAAKVSEEFAGLRDTSRKVQDGKLKASDDIEKAVSDRTDAMRRKFEEERAAMAGDLAAANKKAAEAVSAYKQTFIDRAVTHALSDEKLGVANTAMSDIMDRARRVFFVEEDDSLTPKTPAGQTIYGEDGSSKMSVKQWVDTVLRKDAPHYFKQSNGGGANGGGDAKFGGMSEKDYNALSPRQKLEIANKNFMG